MKVVVALRDYKDRYGRLIKAGTLMRLHDDEAARLEAEGAVKTREPIGPSETKGVQ